MQLDNTFQLKQSQPVVLPKATFEELKNHHSHRPYTYMVDVYEPQESNVRQRLSPEMADMVLENGQDGYFGNPFRLEAEEPRGATLERFREWAVNRMTTDEEYRRRVSELKGKTLICFCSPSLCHGDILAEITESL